MTAELVIIDYGMGNLRSVQKAFEAVGHPATVSADPDVVANATKLVLPGVGAFPDAISRLRQTGLAELVTAHITDGLPFLGICLGMQLLFTRGEEGGLYPGLDIFPGQVVPFPEFHPLKVPHMGWNTLTITRPDCPLFRGLTGEPAVYFVHGYHAVVHERPAIAATADYPDPISAVVWRGNTFATQFHPEKSQAVGLTMLKNFAEVA